MAEITTIAALLTAKNITPSPAYAGEVTGDSYVLALDCTEEGNAASPAEYTPVAFHVATVGAELSPESDEKNYLQEGACALKKSTARSFKISANRYISSVAQDFFCSHAVKFGKGDDVKRGYVYFCALTGKGEKGDVIILVNKDGAADSGEPGEIDVELKCSGTPSEYTYSAT